MPQNTLREKWKATYKPRLLHWCGLLAQAFAEVFIVVIIGILPFLIAVIRYNFDKNDPAHRFDISTVFADSFSGGQLYLYAFSLLGTLMWLGVFNWTVQYRAARLLLALIVILIGFALAGLGGIDPTFSTIRNRAIVDMSVYFYVVSIAIYFLLLVITKLEPPSFRRTLGGETAALIDRYNGLQGQGQ